MATLLDFGNLQPFAQIFPFLLILIMTWAILMRIKPFDDKPAIAAIIAFALALMAMLSPIVRESINRMAPWFVLLFIIGIFILITYQTLGISEQSIVTVITNSEHSPTIIWLIIGVTAAIIIGSLTSVVSEQKGFLELTKTGQVGQAQQADEKTSFFKAVTHPKVLGMAAILLIALFTIQSLGKRGD